MHNTMTIHERIKEGIDLHRRLTGDDPDMIVLSDSAREKFRDELLDEGRPYSSLAPTDPETSPGEVGTVDGVPIRVLPDLPRDYVGVVAGA
jgi:hypothetical protein